MSDENREQTGADQGQTNQQAIADIIEKANIATVTTVDADGSLVSRPLALQSRDFDGELYFFTPAPSGKTEQVKANPAVNVAIDSGGSYLSVAGSGAISQDQELIDRSPRRRPILVTLPAWSSRNQHLVR